VLISLLALLGFAASEIPRALRIDYSGILQAIKNILGQYTELAGTRVEIEPGVLFAAESTPLVELFLDRRDAPQRIQRLAAGRSTDFEVKVSIWCWEYHPESTKEAIDRMSDLIALVELALMQDHSLQDTVVTSWISGGDFNAGPRDVGFIAGGEIQVVAHARARL
jgi:hypothetical protein